MKSTNDWPRVELGKVLRPPSRWKRQDANEYAYIDIASLDSNLKRITTTQPISSNSAPSRATTHVIEDDVLVSTVRPKLNAVAMVPAQMTNAIASSGIAVLRADPDKINPNYLFHVTQSQFFIQRCSDLATGASYPAVSDAKIRSISVPLPPLVEQQRIAEILDQTHTLQTANREQLRLHPQLRESLFNEHFGDPATNPNDFPLIPLGELSAVFSDGPFGSNLKSSHYTPDGVRVIRLQNIGVGEFIDDDQAFISEEHFDSLRKHECLPGDIIVGTLGEPNLRACLVPEGITPALNKADCVQIRVDDSKASVAWMCQLLNMPSTLRLAQAMVKGQTRARIAMGRLRKLKVPVPPIQLQKEFGLQIEVVQRQEALLKKQEENLRDLADSLQARAFTGRL